jgi:hypothetical protein
MEIRTMHCRYVRILVVVLAVGVSVATASAGSYTFTPISNPPGTVGIVIPAGINDSGAIVDTAEVLLVGPGGIPNPVFESFVQSGSVFTPINFPGTPVGSTGAQSINNQGQVVGSVLSNPVSGGFIFSRGTYQSVDIPGAAAATIVFGLNAKGVAVVQQNLDAFGDSASFTFAGGKFTPLSFPGATFTAAIAINNAGDIVGGYTDSSGNNHGFLMHKGVFTTIDDPLATPGGTGPSAITNSGAIVGTYLGSDGSVHGFVYKNGVFTTVDGPPGTSNLDIFSGNDLGQLVGLYTDAAGKAVGFLATPTEDLQAAAVAAAVAVPEPGSLALLAVTGLALAARRLRKRV